MTELEYPAIANTDSLARKFKRTNRLITNKVIYAFLNCKYKASLISKDCQGNISDYEQLQEELLTDSKKTFFHEKRIKARKFYDKQVLNGISITYEDSLFIEPYIKNIEFEIGFHLLERTDFDSINPQWVLYLIISSETPQLIDKIYLAILLIILKRNNIGNIDDGIIIYGKHQRQSKILLNQYHNEALKVFADLTNALNGNEGILPNLNKHCAICQYQAFCLKIMQEKDSLSLLRGLSPKQISKLNNKGIFTIHQFSYTFKPKKKKNNPKPVRLEYALKALALREKKTYIIEIPHLPKSETKIYLDIESLNDESFYYLIGMHINSNNRIDTYSFWSDTPENVENKFVTFLNVFKDLTNYTVYHYGSQEVRVLKKLDKQFDYKYSTQIESIIKNSVNILSLFSSHIYPPTYTNGLKEIGNSLGYKWSFDNASGIQSIVWRKKWELTNNDNFKQLLINYNQEDCRALKIVTEWIERIEAINIENNDDYINANSLKNDTYLKWGKQEFLIPDFEILNTYSYFDYQRSKIFIRTNKSIKKAVKRHINLKDHDKINNEISYVPVNCPNCGYSKFYPHNKNKAVVIDIKFMENGIKKWVIQFPASSFECCDCNFVFGFNKYGRNLMIWSINQYVLYLTSMPKIKSMLQENFNINIDETYLYNFKTDLAKEYLDTYNEIKETIFSGNLIHVDESKTPVMGNPNGYVWVFTNMDSVYYLYRHNREAEFLKDLFKDFKGVVVSDFYSGYSSLSCQQQKCLVHLIRDMNNDLLTNQFNEEFKKLVTDFGRLLRQIIETTDKYGLQKKYLQKHVSGIDEFYEKVLNQDYQTELALAYKRRITRNRDKLFNFIHYDNIPWNNNNAENAIKPLARFRTRAKGILRKDGLKDYLILLSIQQTCKYRGISFLEFLKSKKKSFSIFE